MRIAPIPDLEAYVSNINSSLKLGSGSTGASDMALFSDSKALYASIFHLNENFFRSIVRGIEDKRIIQRIYDKTQ